MIETPLRPSLLNRLTYAVCFVAYLVSAAAHAQTVRMGFADDIPPLSMREDGALKGLIPELAQWLIEHSGDFTFYGEGLPWPRAQQKVEQGELDAFLTYPSAERQRYALFSASPVYLLDSSYLIYSRHNPQRARLEQAQSLADLAGMTLVAQRGTGYIDDNIPSSIQRLLSTHLDGVYHLLFRRGHGDFTLAPPEQALYSAQQLGYREALLYRSVDFIPNARIPLHLGISRQQPQAAQWLAALERTLNSAAFRQARDAITARYRQTAP